MKHGVGEVFIIFFLSPVISNYDASFQMSLLGKGGPAISESRAIFGSVLSIRTLSHPSGDWQRGANSLPPPNRRSPISSSPLLFPPPPCGKGRYKVLANNNLQIHQVTKADEGVYRCEASVEARGEIDFVDIAVVVNGELERRFTIVWGEGQHIRTFTLNFYFCICLKL